MSERKTERENAPSAEDLKASVRDAIGKLTGRRRNEPEGRHRTREAEPPEVADPRGR